ncbi:hypothetical protein GGQ82_003297 [Sphingobium olei]
MRGGACFGASPLRQVRVALPARPVAAEANPCGVLHSRFRPSVSSPACAWPFGRGSPPIPAFAGRLCAFLGWLEDRPCQNDHAAAPAARVRKRKYTSARTLTCRPCASAAFSFPSWTCGRRSTQSDGRIPLPSWPESGALEIQQRRSQVGAKKRYAEPAIPHLHHCRHPPILACVPLNVAAIASHTASLHGGSGACGPCPRNGFAGLLPRPVGLPREPRKPASGRPPLALWSLGCAAAGRRPVDRHRGRMGRRSSNRRELLMAQIGSFTRNEDGVYNGEFARSPFASRPAFGR